MRIWNLVICPFNKWAILFLCRLLLCQVVGLPRLLLRLSSAQSNDMPFLYKGMSYVSFTRGEYPVTATWIPQTFSNSRGITKAVVTGNMPFSGQGSLELDVDLVGEDAERSQGEVFADLRFRPPTCLDISTPLPPLETACVRGPIDLSNIEISARVFTPTGSRGDRSRPNGLQVFAKSIDMVDGQEEFRNFFGSFVNIEEQNWNLVTATVRNVPDGCPGSAGCQDGEFIDPEFDPDKSRPGRFEDRHRRWVKCDLLW